MSERNWQADLELCERASEGPYHLGRDTEEPDTFLIGSKCTIWCRVVGGPGRPAEAIAELFAFSRTGWPAALRRVLELEALVASLSAKLADYSAGMTRLAEAEGELARLKAAILRHPDNCAGITPSDCLDAIRNTALGKRAEGQP